MMMTNPSVIWSDWYTRTKILCLLKEYYVFFNVYVRIVEIFMDNTKEYTIWTIVAIQIPMGVTFQQENWHKDMTRQISYLVLLLLSILLY